MDSVQGGRGNEDNCAVRDLNPHMSLEFNSSPGSDNLIGLT